MKKLLLIIAVLVPIAIAPTFARNLSKARLKALVSDCRNYDGVETVRIGGLATAALRGVVRLSAAGDRDVKQALPLIKGVRSLCIMDYEDCSIEDKSFIDARIGRALEDYEVLMEAVDNGEVMRIYGMVDDESVRDFVLWSDSALIWVFGTVKLSALANLIEND